MSDLGLERTNNASNGTELIGHSAYIGYSNDYVLRVADNGGAADALYAYAPGGGGGGVAIRADGLDHGVLATGAPGVEGTSTEQEGVIGRATGHPFAGVRGDSEKGDGVSGHGGMNGASGYTSNKDASGVYGENQFDDTDFGTRATAYAVAGRSKSGTALYGEGLLVGVEGKGAWGVSANGKSFGVYTNGPIGIVGRGTSHAADFTGDVVVAGKVQSQAVRLQVDHPLDPGTKFLNHAVVGSAETKSVYDGVVVLDDHGEANVEVPDWLVAFNSHYRYQLTCLGEWAPVYIAKKLSDGSFKIAGGNAAMEVCWQLTGIRKDVAAASDKLEVETEKTEAERGRYLNPELFGQPSDKAIGPHTRLQNGHV